MLFRSGAAKATAKFLNGLVVSQGQYLNSQGQPSSFTVLQNQQYNNYTYELTVSKEIEKYRSVLLSLLHPTGMKVKGKYSIKEGGNFNTSYQQKTNLGHTLQYYTNDPISFVTLSVDPSLQSGTNIVGFTNLTNLTKQAIINHLTTQEIPVKFAKDIQGIINFMQNTVGTSEEKLLFSIKELDERRNQNLSQTAPELANLLGYYG